MATKLTSEKSNIIGVIDIGSAKTVCLITVPDEDRYRVIGLGHQPTVGMQGGRVIDMKSTENAIYNAVSQAERMAGEQLRNVYVCYSGDAIRSKVLHIEIPVHSENISETDIHRLHTQCYNGIENSSWQILHTIPIRYQADNMTNINDPRQMLANTLAADMHVIAVPVNSLRNLCLCIERNRLKIKGITLSAYATALSLLYEDQMKLGSTVIDFGHDTTSIAVFKGGHLVYLDTIPLGSHHITNDIACGLNTSIANAERIKTLYGGAISSIMDEREIITIPPRDNEPHGQENQIVKSLLMSIITPRVEEIFEMIREKLDRLNSNIMVGQNIILAGGGGQLTSVADLAQRILDKPVFIGQSHGVKGLGSDAMGPTFSAAAGLLRYADMAHTINIAPSTPEEAVNLSLFGRLGHWIKYNF